MKKGRKLIGFILSLYLIFGMLNISVFALNDKEPESYEPKTYSQATIDQNFDGSSVLVVMDKNVGEINKRHSKSFFGNVEIEDIIDLTEINGALGSKMVDKENFRQVLQIKLPTDSKSNVLNVISYLEEIDGIKSVEPNYYRTSFVIPNDNYYTIGWQWGLDKINAPAAWDITTGSADVKVGVIDTGIASHFDLDANLTDGWDFYNDDGITTDDEIGHGTHVAGIIGAVGNNGTGVAGVCWTVTLVPLQVYNTDTGFFLDSSIIDAIYYAADENIPILNMSLGGEECSSALEQALKSYEGLVVCAAGNNGKDNDKTAIYPSNYELDNLIAVGSSNNIDNWSYFSNYGATTVDLFAPGHEIYSTVPGDIDSKFGTSMAAPHVTGVAALIKSVDPALDATEIKSIILSNVDVLPVTLGNKCVTDGRLNAYKAVNAAATGSVNTYTISYDANGGSGAPASQTKLQSVPVKLSETEPLKAGHLFLGWATSSGATTPIYQSGDQFTTDTNITLYAVWYLGLSVSPAISAGTLHSMMLKTNGMVWTWGSNSNGQLGIGNNIDKSIPACVSTLSGVIAVSAGSSHSMALKSDGTVWAWGLNSSGQLGNNTIMNTLSPIQVLNLSDIIAVSAGLDYSMALKSDGTVWVWGSNMFDALGIGSTLNQLLPVQVSTLSDVIAISTGTIHSMALKSDGTVWAWGRNNYGQLGNNTTTNTSSPIHVSTLSDVIAISVGGSHSMALKNDGTVWAWGLNSSGQLGNNTIMNTLSPIHVSTLSDVIAISAGSNHSMALKNDGTVWTWGSNNLGQLGIGDTTSQLSPVHVLTLSDVIAISAGSSYSMALKSDGTIWAWGRNDCGQLGNKSLTNQLFPLPVGKGRELNAYTISYDVNGGIGNLASQLKEHGIDLKLRSKVPTKASNIFLGWSTSANATVPEYQPSDMFLIDANTTLYAVWGIAPIIVQDVGNIHSGVTDLFVEALGFDLTYQWYTNTTNSNVGGIPIDDATEDTYALPSNDSTKFYYCEITSTDQSSSNTIKSNVAARPDIIAAFGSDIRFGSDYGIETEFGDIIYGLAPHSLYSTFEYDADTYIDTVGGATYIFDYDEYDQVVSTGAQIVVLDEFGVEIKRYTFIVFGDMNGDGTIDGTDLSILEDIVVDDLYNVHYYISGPTNILANPYYFAGDINANGKLDTGDYTYIHREAVSCEGYMTQVYEAPYFIDYNGWSGIVPNVPSTISFKDAGAYGPSFGKWICGLTERIRPTAMQPGGISQNISVIGDATVEVIPSSGNREGTGTKVIVRDGSGTIIDEYTVIVFGDINRDGNADGQDAVLLNYYLSGLNINLDMYQMAAADVDGDGDVDWDDYDALVQAGLFNYIVNQVR